MSKLEEGWYLIYTKPSHEKKVNVRLTNYNINAFLPMKRSLRIWHDRKKYIDQPLFPSYIFVYLKDKKDYYDVLDMEGVLYYVRSGKEIAQISESVINNIMIIAEQVNELEVTDNYFEPGRQLLINKGPLAGLACEIVNYNNDRKLLVRVDLLQRSLLVTMPSENLVAI